MGYPESIPTVKAKDSKEFDKRLRNFSLTEEQIEFYKEGRKRFKENTCSRLI